MADCRYVFFLNGVQGMNVPYGVFDLDQLYQARTRVYRP